MIPEVEPLEAINRIDAGAFLLDVREADEWEMGHAPEATWIPLGELASRVSEIPADSEILVI
ncbi:MAG: sulfurtransferase, partial [Actinobacteria bacterium]